MKQILLVMALAGCGKQEQADTNESTPTTTAKPVKELTLEEKVAGTYEVKIEEDTITFVLLENGKHEAYVNGESWKKAEVKVTWKMVGKEVHIGEKYSQDVYKIEPNGDLTHIADIVGGMRTDQKNQSTIKRIK